MIDSEHAAKRITQLSGICLKLFKEMEDEAEINAQEMRDFGVDIETPQVGINPSTVFYRPWHRFIEFYSQFL